MTDHIRQRGWETGIVAEMTEHIRQRVGTGIVARMTEHIRQRVGDRDCG